MEHARWGVDSRTALFGGTALSHTYARCSSFSIAEQGVRTMGCGLNEVGRLHADGLRVSPARGGSGEGRTLLGVAQLGEEPA
jgi:hypothetical protein